MQRKQGRRVGTTLTGRGPKTTAAPKKSFDKCEGVSAENPLGNGNFVRGVRGVYSPEKLRRKFEGCRGHLPESSKSPMTSVGAAGISFYPYAFGQALG